MTINPDGTLTVPAATPAGVYPVEYRICEVANPANCDTAIASVTVSPVIDAVADDLSGSPILPSGGGSPILPACGATPTVFANDTLNGAAFLPAAVIPTIVADGGLAGVTINPDGTLTVPAATPPGLPVEYRICEVANPANCDTAIVPGHGVAGHRRGRRRLRRLADPALRRGDADGVRQRHAERRGLPAGRRDPERSSPMAA
ncbi:MAG: hypothetical protein IPL47_12250 [Phyllobacteriaceae bacterium]|nr:hypothetical protein [Phyllobacteriaceae bacterium]